MPDNRKCIRPGIIKAVVFVTSLGRRYRMRLLYKDILWRLGRLLKCLIEHIHIELLGK